MSPLWWVSQSLNVDPIAAPIKGFLYLGQQKEMVAVLLLWYGVCGMVNWYSIFRVWRFFFTLLLIGAKVPLPGHPTELVLIFSASVIGFCYYSVTHVMCPLA